MKYCFKITVFTPTYNRAYIIGNLYESLCRQSFKHFEWLIVDDGSSDNTEELVNQWIKDDPGFIIRYYKQKNGGKCRAINYGLDLSKGELFFTVDSDDYLTDDALEKVTEWEARLPKDQNYCGVSGSIGTDSRSPSGTLFENGYFDGTLLDRYGVVTGERAIVLYTDVHRRYKYPVFSDEKFMTEAVVWNRMAHDGFKIRFYNDVIWIYEYRDDGLTKAGNRLFYDNPKGYCLWLKERLMFCNANIFDLFRLYYTVYSELNHRYSIATIAECLQTNILTVYICKLIFMIKNGRHLE